MSRFIRSPCYILITLHGVTMATSTCRAVQSSCSDDRIQTGTGNE